MYCASRIPTTIVSWLIDTSRPRNCAGATSAMYMGDRFDARPMATPPSIRHATKMVKSGASAFPIEVPAKRKAEKISSRLRPNLSLIAPATSAPTRQPMSAQLFAHPDCAALVRWKYLSKNGFAPPMTTQS